MIFWYLQDQAIYKSINNNNKQLTEAAEHKSAAIHLTCKCNCHCVAPVIYYYEFAMQKICVICFIFIYLHILIYMLALSWVECIHSVIHLQQYWVKPHQKLLQNMILHCISVSVYVTNCSFSKWHDLPTNVLSFEKVYPVWVLSKSTQRCPRWKYASPNVGSGWVKPSSWGKSAAGIAYNLQLAAGGAWVAGRSWKRGGVCLWRCKPIGSVNCKLTGVLQCVRLVA